MEPPLQGPPTANGLAAGTGDPAGPCGADPPADLAFKLPRREPRSRSFRCIERAGQPWPSSSVAALWAESGQPQRYVVVARPPWQPG